MNGFAFALQLALALLFGAVIGAERQWRQRMAGLPTNALVSSGAAMFVLGGRLMTAPTDSVLRMAAQVVSGILVDDPKDKTFAPFSDARHKIEGEAIKRGTCPGCVTTNATIDQTVMERSGESCRPAC